MASRLPWRMAAALGMVTALWGSPAAVAGIPKACQPDSRQQAQLTEAQRVFRAADLGEAIVLWDGLMQASADGPSCRTVEIAWRIGDFLKRQKESPELALRYLNRGIAAYEKGLPGDDLPLGKVFKTSGHFFKRQGDLAHACQSLNAALRIFGQFGDTTVEMTQTQAEMADAGCTGVAAAR